MLHNTVKFTIGLADPAHEETEVIRFCNKLLRDLRRRDDIERVQRAERVVHDKDSNDDPYYRSKGFSTILGLLTAEVSFKNIKSFFEFLDERVSDKPIKISIELGDKKVTLEANSSRELAIARNATLDIINSFTGAQNDCI